MKWAKAFLDSIYFSYVGWFGGTVNGKGKIYYVLWTIHLNPDSYQVWKNCHIIAIRELDCVFYVHASRRAK